MEMMELGGQVASFAGGSLIGLSALLLLAANGRIMGVSGIAGELVSSALRGRARAAASGEVSWRLAFIGGLLATGTLLALFSDTFAYAVPQGRSLGIFALAGLLVGYGTRAGLGCTSGHGICGMGRLSGRSLVATILFMTAGVLVASIFSLVLSSGVTP